MNRQAPTICIGEIATAHGVRGLVRVKSFTARPADLGRYGELSDETGTRSFRLELLSSHTNNQWLAKIGGVSDRNAAEALRGTRLFVPRDRLPALPDGEYYHADLIGLAAVSPEGEALGTVRNILDFGAGSVLEIAAEGEETMLVPFTKACVGDISAETGTVIITPPAEDAA